MTRVDRGQYEVLNDEDVVIDFESSENAPLINLKLDATHNLDVFFTQIYKYHQSGGFAVILTSYILTALKFVFLFYCLVELTVCVKWDRLMDPNFVIKDWADVVCPFGECWASLPPLPTICLIIAIVVFACHIVRSSICIVQIWGVQRFCSLSLDLPKSDSELADITWSDVLHRIISVQTQMQISPNKPQLDELDIYNRILRRTNYLIGMINKEAIPVRFQLPFSKSKNSNSYIYLPHFYLLNLKWLLFWGPKCPFVSYWQLRPEYKWFTKREELAAEFTQQARIIGVTGLLLSPLVFLIQLLLFLCSNAERLRYEPSSFFGRRWSNYAHFYLRHFNELRHEFVVRLNQAYLPATNYLDCFPSRLLNVIAENVAFTVGGVSVLLFGASLLKEQLIHLSGYLAIMAVGGLLARICVGILPDDTTVYFPRAKLIDTLARIHYMPDHWKEHAHTNQVRHEFSQLFQFRIVGGLEELLSPLLTPLILIFYLPYHSIEIVDFLRNFTVELQGVGDICSFAQLDIPRHGHPDWNPNDEEQNDSYEEKSPVHDHPKWNEDDVSSSLDEHTMPNLPALGGKTELSLMHFHFTNPRWRLPPDSRAYLTAVHKQALADLQRQQQEQLDLVMGKRTSIEESESMAISVLASTKIIASPTAALYRSLYAPLPRTQSSTEHGPVYSSDFMTHAKNVSHLPMTSASSGLGIGNALAVSMMMSGESEGSSAVSPTSRQPTRHMKKTAISVSKSTDATESIGDNLPPPPMTSSAFSQAPTPRMVPTSFTPTFSAMAASGMYNFQAFQNSYHPYTSQYEDKTGLSGSFFNPNLAGSLSYGAAGSILGELTTDMDASSLYIHELHQRQKLKRFNNHYQLASPALPVHNLSSGTSSSYRPALHPHPASAGQLISGGEGQHWETTYQQQPLTVRGSHFLGAVGRGRSSLLLTHGPPGCLIRGAAPSGQFEEVAEEEGEVEDEQEQETHQKQSLPRTHVTSPQQRGSFSIPDWPDLPPPTC